MANHTNGLVDGLLLMTALRRYPRFLGKATLFKIPPLWPFLKLAGVIPVYGRSMRRRGITTCRHSPSAIVAEQGGMVAVFPEGISHDEPALQQLKTGAARIALEAAHGGGADGLVTVAVGLVYDAKARFRSRALVRVGAPGEWPSGPSPTGATNGPRRAPSPRIWRCSSPESTPATPRGRRPSSWRAWPRWLSVALTGPGAAEVALADQVEVAARLAAVQDASPASLRPLFVDFAAYERDLALLGVNDAQLVARHRQRRLRLSIAGAALELILAVPVAIIGVAVHVVPFEIMKQAGKRPTNEGIKATVKLLGCLVLFAATYAVVGVAVGRALGPWAGLTAAVAAPLCGYVAVRLHERVKRIGGVVEGYRMIRGRRDVVGAVMARRAGVVRDARAVLVHASAPRPFATVPIGPRWQRCGGLARCPTGRARFRSWC